MPDLDALFDQAISEDADDYGPPEHWRFSGLGKCPRAQILERMGVPRTPFSVKTRILLKIGHLLEDQALKWLGSKVDIIAKQVTVDAPQWDARGHLDALVRLDNEIAVVEVKSTRDRGVEYAPYDNHVLQATAYAIFLGLPTSFLLYVGRDGARKFVECRPSHEIERKIKNEWSMLTGYLRAGVVPPKQPFVQSVKKVKGQEVPWVFERSGPWGRRGDPRMEPPRAASYCPFAGQPICCGSGDQDVSRLSLGEASDGVPEEWSPPQGAPQLLSGVSASEVSEVGGAKRGDTTGEAGRVSPEAHIEGGEEA